MDNETLSATAHRLLPLARAYAARREGTLVRELGSGGTASVFLLRIGEADTALKVYDPRFLDEVNGPTERRRIELQRRLIGHGCPTLIDVTQIVLADGTCFIEMEYVEWENLRNVISRTPADCIENLFGQLVSAVQFLDDRGLVHRDIKPENVLVDAGFNSLKLIDFGVMREAGHGEDAIDATDHGLRRPFIASAQYSSPEYLFRLKEPSPEMWKALTIYQLGGVLHDLLEKKPLFDDVVKTDNKFALAMAVLAHAPTFVEVPEALKSWVVLAANCLVKDPSLRLALVDLKQMKPIVGSGVERLKQVRERKQALKATHDGRSHQEAQILRVRVDALDELQSRVRQLLIPLVDKSYGIVAYRDEDRRIRFDIAMDNNVKLQIACHFEWVGDLTPLFANVTLTATLGPVPDGVSRKVQAVGQFAAGSAPDTQFVTVALDAVCNVVAATAEFMALGVADGGESQFVDAVLLLEAV